LNRSFHPPILTTLSFGSFYSNYRFLNIEFGHIRTSMKRDIEDEVGMKGTQTAKKSQLE
ncbi:hypothetical protein LINPERHAP2_LOCUS26833, partial [Linum perenne]